MAKIKKLLALILSICVICTVSVMSVSAANTDDDNDTSASSTITVHYYCEEGTPTIYYWNSLPKNISTEYPGVKMTSEGNNYYKYTFNDGNKNQYDVCYKRKAVCGTHKKHRRVVVQK